MGRGISTVFVSPLLISVFTNPEQLHRRDHGTDDVFHI